MIDAEARRARLVARHHHDRTATDASLGAVYSFSSTTAVP